MNTRAKAAFSTADTLAVAKANCAPKRNPPRSRGGSKPTDPKRKEPATPTPKLKTSDKGPSNLKPAPEKNIEKATLPCSTPDDPKKARKGRQGRQGPGSTPPGISSLKEAVIGGKPKGDPEAANSPRTPPSDNPPVPLLGQQTPSESGDDEFPDPSKKIDFGSNNLAQSDIIQSVVGSKRFGRAHDCWTAKCSYRGLVLLSTRDLIGWCYRIAILLDGARCAWLCKQVGCLKVCLCFRPILKSSRRWSFNVSMSTLQAGWHILRSQCLSAKALIVSLSD